MRGSTAISYIFSKIVAFLYLGLQLVILPLQVFSVALQLLHLPCLLLLFPLHVLTLIEELVLWRLDHRIIDITAALDESDVEGGIDRGLGGEGLLDNHWS